MVYGLVTMFAQLAFAVVHDQVIGLILFFSLEQAAEKALGFPGPGAEPFYG